MNVGAPAYPRLILFAESDGGWALATSGGLQARGWSVAWASDTHTAMLTARRTLPDVVIVDAGLDGGGHRLGKEEGRRQDRAAERRGGTA